MFIYHIRLKRLLAFILLGVFLIAGLWSGLYLCRKHHLTTANETTADHPSEEDGSSEGAPDVVDGGQEDAVDPLGEEAQIGEVPDPSASPDTTKKYIKWVDFQVPYEAMEAALQYDIKSYGSETKVNWIEALAYLGAKYGGNFASYKKVDLDAFVKRLNEGESVEDITAGMKYYDYYIEAYDAVLHEFVGEYQVQKTNEAGESITESTYGLKVFSPIARGYSFSHYEDFGTGRSYGYQRKHLGNDLLGSIGTPIVAVESGVVESMEWNQYGGWRIGIRSFDKKRYYYYAHLRKGKPYHPDLYEGKIVNAGDVIGYLGMTGYSTKEDTNNIQIPHLHFGMQLIFDESQKDGVNQIWIDVYDIINLLQKHKSPVYKDEQSGHFYPQQPIIDPTISSLIQGPPAE